ncbi:MULTISPECIES: zinc ribbon domain-containing protein [unclassified Flavobacterium]|uniref:zinc ribbon domain-containing protein n=1 Tax=unclassified Flavobacterium TaxID=196869 RepID=UPI001F1437BD|nr:MULTISPECIES: zinc ribbon domain-containing protein [unclassified Flavobacterium]UMY67017.1 zinc ribbon domain-containing protein [Flavobacterium sp. HJ-32-4]
MIFFYGVRHKRLLSRNVSDACPNCGIAGSLTLTVRMRYTHFLLIPFFPAGKRTEGMCSGCGQPIAHWAMNGALLKRSHELQREAKTPFWMYTFSGMLVAVLLLAFIEAKASGEQDAIYVKNPKVGDIYEFEMESGKYTLLRVASVSKDTVGVYYNSYMSDEISGLYDIRDSMFIPGSDKIAKSELRRLLDENKILSVERP